MTTRAAPRIDDRLRRVIAGSAATDTPAAITRLVGNLAWELGLQRPSYEQVRVLVRSVDSGFVSVPARPVVTRASVARAVTKTIDFVYQYPAWGMEDWYRRYKRGGL
jgi:hypothetical protein